MMPKEVVDIKRMEETVPLESGISFLKIID
jgi:hypothetical protein